MTPPASTPAGRRSTSDSAPAERRGITDPGHRRTVRRQVAPTAPRRVSGPSTGRVAAPDTARVTTPERPIQRPRRPAPKRTSPRRPALSLQARIAGFVRALPDHPLLDRIVRGRAWIPLLGVMLVGIVAMQVEILKSGATVGRAIEQGSALQSRNELLRASVATLADDQRIERLAARMGMVMPTPTEVAFLSTRAADVRRAAASIHEPDPSAFAASLAAAAALASGPATTTPTTSATTLTSTTVPATTTATTTPATTATTTSTTTTPSTTTPVTGTAPANTTSATTAPPTTTASGTTQPVAPTSLSGGASVSSGG